MRYNPVSGSQIRALFEHSRRVEFYDNIYPMNTSEKYEKIISGVEIILPKESFKKRIETSIIEGKPLKIKLGFDPTAPDLHLGHMVVLKKLRDFQDVGHEIHIIIGSFTAMIGDPTGKNKTRPPLNSKDIEKNSNTYVKQLGKVLDLKKTKIHFNDKWFKKFRGEEIAELLSKYTVNRLLTREDFSNRIKNKVDIHTHEMLYPMLQGYDSLQIGADVEIGGTDQLFNMQVGRHIQSESGFKSQHVLCMPILKGLDGKKKMSKSLNNYIGIYESVKDIERKIKEIPDSIIKEYLDLLTDFSKEEKQNILSQLNENPEFVKNKITEDILRQLS